MPARIKAFPCGKPLISQGFRFLDAKSTVGFHLMRLAVTSSWVAPLLLITGGLLWADEPPLVQPPAHGIDPRIVGRLSKLGLRPHAFFVREHQLIHIDVSAVLRRAKPENLARTAMSFQRYAEFGFPLIASTETEALAPGTSPVVLNFKAFGFTTAARIVRTPLRNVDGDAWTGSWTLELRPGQDDFRVFNGTVYVKPLDEDRVYLRYRLSIQPTYMPPEWLMSLVVDNVGRKLARDGVRSILRAAEREEETERDRTDRDRIRAPWRETEEEGVRESSPAPPQPPTVGGEHGKP